MNSAARTESGNENTSESPANDDQKAPTSDDDEIDWKSCFVQDIRINGKDYESYSPQN
jgi:hypothetical protein